MKLIKKTATHTIFQRRDGRYAVRTAKRKPVNGDEKVSILIAEGLLTPASPKAAEPEPEEVTAAEGEEATAENAEADEAEKTEE